MAYFSRLLKKHELRYSVPEKECLGMLEGMRHFRPYLWGREFTVVSDHQALQWLHKTKETNGRLYRWFIKLAHDRYDYTVIHRAGKDHGNADGISRLMCEGEVEGEQICVIQIEEEHSDVYFGRKGSTPVATYNNTGGDPWLKLPPHPSINVVTEQSPPAAPGPTNATSLTKADPTPASPPTTPPQGKDEGGGGKEGKEENTSPDLPKVDEEEPNDDLNRLRAEQLKCTDTAQLIKFVLEAILPKSKQLKRIAIQEGKNLIMQHGVLYRIAQGETSLKKIPRLQAVLPVTMRADAMTAMHDSLLGGGHLSHKKTYMKLTERWWWPGIYVDSRH